MANSQYFLEGLVISTLRALKIPHSGFNLLHWKSDQLTNSEMMKNLKIFPFLCITCNRYKISVAKCWLDLLKIWNFSLTDDFICWLLTCSRWLLTSTYWRQETYFVHRKRPTTSTSVWIVFTFHFWITMETHLSVIGILNAMPSMFILFGTGSNTGTWYSVHDKNCEIDILVDAWKNLCY